MADYNPYVDDDLIITGLLFSGMAQNDIDGLIRRHGGNVRKAFEAVKTDGTYKKNNRYNNVKAWLDHLGTGNMEKLLTETAGIKGDVAKTAIYKAQREVGGVATPTLDRVLFFLGSEPDGRAQSFAATIRPQLQGLGRSDSALMTTRTQYKTGQKPVSSPAPPPPAPPPPPPPGPAKPLSPAAQALVPKGGIKADTGNITAGARVAGPGTGEAPKKEKAPGTVTQTPGAGTAAAVTDTTPALGAGASDQAVRDYVRKHYSQFSWLLDIPDVAHVMRLAAEKGWDTAEVDGAFVATDWYRKTEPAARLWAEKMAVDPADAKDQIDKTTTVFRNHALSLGVNVPDSELRRLAEESLRFGWDDNEKRAALGQFYKYDPKNLVGAAQATSNHLKAAAREWMVPLDDATLAQWTEKVIRGEATTDYFDTYLAQQAGSLFPQLADPISRGIAPGQWMAPYKTLAAQHLGINPDEIDLREGKWMRAINQVDDKGQRKAMTLYDWENLIKTDEVYGWDKTQAGRDHGAGLARSVAAQFGFASAGGL